MSARATAIRLGASTYEGGPCKRDPNHGTKRYTPSGVCVACLRLQTARRRAERRVSPDQPQRQVEHSRASRPSQPRFVAERRAEYAALFADLEKRYAPDYGDEDGAPSSACGQP